MAPQDVDVHLHRRPFVPFRIVSSDGQVYDIRHPDLVMLGLASIIIGIPPNPGGRYYERTIYLSLFHVVRIEPLEPAATGQGAEPSSAM